MEHRGGLWSAAGGGGGGDKARKGKGRQGFRKERVPKWDLWELT